MVRRSEGMENQQEQQYYQIKVLGVLDDSWADWFNGMIVTIQSEDLGRQFTLLTGAVADQACLRGILDRLWDLNLKVISVQLIPPTE
jgi:hypothetical protein